ncbi:MAG: hypothetical protein Q9174_004011 [Haloplaca sp. 1 TL-2023]
MFARDVGQGQGTGEMKDEEDFWPGDAVFLFGETKFMEEVKSREIESDLCGGDKKLIQAIKARPMGAMHARFALPVVGDVSGMGAKRNREEWERMRRESGKGTKKSRDGWCVVS